MANQPTKYRKFVVGAASAALVASAVAPVASAATFSDVSEGNSHKASIDALVAKGVISGYPDGTFKPTQTLKRSDVVKMMGKWLKSEGYTVAADYKTNPRFADLTSSSNEELLEMAALVKDNGLFVGTPDGKLDPNGNITRENMAIVIVRAFDTVHNIDLATYVAGQEFKKDVVDLAKAKAEARPAIDVLDYFDITNPAAPSFNPKDTTNRAQFASFLNKAIETDYSEVTSGVVGDVAVKAVNATTVEVTFKDAVENINSLNFTIEGLTVSNAAVKQTDNKTVVLTTAVQEGGKEYTVALNNDKIGTFKGVSAVVPTKITVNTTSVQAKVGQEAILSADVGVKQAGIPVTFNVDASGTLNKDQIFEVVTNADGIATFSYTQYSADVDSVSAYPTGAPAVRDFAKVYWGVDNILTIDADDKKDNQINNGENKAYKVTYKDAKTGKPVANARLNVTFAENVDTEINKITNATVNGKTPYQLNNGKTEVVTVTTNSKGEASLTVSGQNTKATPIVFVDDVVNNRVGGNDRLEATELQAKASQLEIGAVQSSYVIDVTRDGGQEAATGYKNGRTYKVAVTTKDGKAAANETVNVSFDEILDRNMNTNTSAVFVKSGNVHSDATKAGQQLSIKLNSKGEGSFTIAVPEATTYENEYATPVVWIDINSSNAKDGNLDEGEPNKVADITYFAKEALTGGTVKAYDVNGEEVDEDEKFDGDKAAYFKFTAANQSGKKMDLPSGYDRIEATFTVWNTGDHDVVVEGKTVSPNRSTTVTIKNSVEPTIKVETDNKTTSVRVEARGTAEPTNSRNNRLQPINLGSHTAKASFVSTKDIGVIHTGIIKDIIVKDKEIEFEGKTKVSYKGASFKNANGISLTEAEFVKLVQDNLGTIKVTVKKDGDKVTFEIVSLNADLSATLEAVNAAATDAQVQAALEKSEMAPAFKALNTAQKGLVAAEVNRVKPVNGFTEIGLKNAYAAAYDSKAVQPALLAVKGTTNAANLANVPGLNLTSYNALNATDAGTVNSAIQGKTFTKVADLQVALDNAIAGLSTTALLNALNTATTNADALVALKAIPNVDLTDFEKAPARVQQLVLEDLQVPTFTTTQQVAGTITTSLDAHKDDTSVAIEGLTYTAAGVGASADTLTITFSDALDLDPSLTSEEIVSALGLTFKDGNTLGAGATATVANGTGSEKVVTITLGAGHTMNKGAVLTAVAVRDEYKVVIDLNAFKADGKTLVTPAIQLVVQ